MGKPGKGICFLLICREWENIGSGSNVCLRLALRAGRFGSEIALRNTGYWPEERCLPEGRIARVADRWQKRPEHSMISLPKRRSSRAGSRASAARRAVAGLTVIFFFLPLSRFYLAIELEPINCLGHEHSHTVALPSGHTHSHSSELLPAGPSGPSGDDHGFFFQHCKDQYETMIVGSLLTLGVPATISFQQPESAPALVAPESFGLADADLPPPFHPPRYRS